MTDSIDRDALDMLLETVGGDLEFLAELIEEFFEDSPQQLAAARQALAAGDAGSLRRAAHSLKSNSANFGATALSQTCKKLEDLAKGGTLDGAGELIDRATAQYQQAQKALEAVLKGG